MNVELSDAQTDLLHELSRQISLEGKHRITADYSCSVLEGRISWIFLLWFVNTIKLAHSRPG